MKITKHRGWADKKRSMDRFGGGWRWHLGFQANPGFREIVVYLMAWSFYIRRDKRPALPPQAN